MSHNLPQEIVSFKNLRRLALMFLLGALLLYRVPSFAQTAHENAGHGPDTAGSTATEATESAEKLTGEDVGAHGGSVETHGAEHGVGEHEEVPGTFDPHAGTWLHPVARFLFEGGKPVEVVEHGGEKHLKNIKSDFLVVSLFIMISLALIGVAGARKMKLRPEGKPMSVSNMVETAAEGFREYLIGVMGPALANKYAPLISSYFFTILFFNYMGLVPGMIAPTSNPNVPVALALVAFFCVHIIAIKEAGIKSWFMHLVGEPLWLAPLNFPLHLMGELIKPMSLSIRLLCNVFGEEMVVLQLSLLAVGIFASTHLPLPLQFPILCLGLLFGLLQALVFSTLLAIYISILANHHDDHDEHNIHGHVEPARVHGHNELIAHPSETSVA